MAKGAIEALVLSRSERLGIACYTPAMGVAGAIVSMLAVFTIGTALNVLAAVLPSTREDHAGWPARAVAVALSTSVLLLPFVLEGPPFFTALVAQVLIVETWRVVEVVRTPSRYPRRERIARVVLLPYEFSFLERTERRWPLRDFAASTALFAVGVAALVIASSLSPPVPPYAPRGWPRWLGASAAGYLIMEGATRQWVLALLPCGWRHRPYQRHPILSRTLAEFWGVRWSSVVHEWLRSNVYEPLSRRGAPRAGVVAAFFVSALLHAYFVWPAAGPLPALWMLGFFVAHGGGMLLEAKLAIRRWGRLQSRLFVIALFVATVPLFMEPILRAVGL